MCALSSWLSCRGRFKLRKMAITHLILVGSLKFQHIWLQGEILHWFLPKKHKKWPFDKNRSKEQNLQQKKLFYERNFYVKETFQRNKLFNKTNFLTMKQTFRQNNFFVATNFSTKQTFWRNILFDETNFFTKQILK